MGKLLSIKIGDGFIMLGDILIALQVFNGIEIFALMAQPVQEIVQ
jgi:hypothetical protein